MLRINVLDIAEAVGSIDERFIEEHLARREELAAKAGKRAARAEDPAGKAPAARRFGLKRILAAAAAAAAVIAVSAFAVAQFAKTPPIPAPVGAAPVESAFSVPEDAVSPAESSTVSLPAESSTVSLPHVNGGPGGYAGGLVMNDPRFKKAFDEAECVAHIKVLEKLELDLGPDITAFTTFFKVELKEVFKGEFQDVADDNTIKIAQPGSEKMLFGMNLFQSGEEYLLYLDPVESENDGIIYKMFGANYSVVDVIHADGETYYCDRCGILSSTYTEDTGYDYVYNDEALVNKLIDAAGKDSAPAEWLRYRLDYGEKTFILTREELIRAFDELQK